MVNNASNFNTIMEIGSLSKEGVIIYSLSTKTIFYVNDIGSGMTGLRASNSNVTMDLALKNVMDEDKDYLRHHFNFAPDFPDSSEIEFRIKGLTPDIKHICCNIYVVSAKSHLVIFLRDVTRPKHHETYLIEFGMKKNTLLEILTHQIGGALNLMRQLALQAKKLIDRNDKNELSAYFSLVDDNSKFCLEIIDNLLEQEHNKTSNVVAKMDRVDVVVVLELIIEELRKNYRHRDFEFDAPRRGIYTNTDQVKLLQVITNLASNAVKFSADGAKIIFVVSVTDVHVTISLFDEGIGIPDDLKARIFERKTGAGRTGLKGEKSIGIGLSISKNLVELLNGEIWFESVEGRGSIFHVSLPKN